MLHYLLPIPFLALVGCAPGVVKIEDSATVETPADTDTDTDADTDADTDTDTDTPTGPLGDCEADPDLAVVSVETSSFPGLTLGARLDVSLSKSADLGVVCYRDGDADVLYWESAAAASHQIDLLGLAPNATYACTAAPVCPHMTGDGALFTVTTGASPAQLPGLDVERHASLTPADPPYLLLNSGPCSINGEATYLAMFDLDGIPRWYSTLPAGLWADVTADYLGGGEMSWGGGYSTGGAAHRTDMLGNVLHAAAFPGSNTITFTHEGHVLPDGRFLSFAWVNNTRGRDTWSGFEIYISNVDDELEWEWNTQGGSDAGLLPSGRGADAHGNWAELVDRDDGSQRVYASACYWDTILAIDEPTGDILWRFGPDGDFTVVDETGAPLGDDGFSDCQHGIDIDGDRMLVYDNGMDRAYSRVSEYALDEATGTATRLWTWTEDGWDADWLGDADYLGGERVLLTQGEQDCAWSSGDAVKSKVTEVDRASGEVVWRGTFDTEDNLTYRSQRVDACDVMPNVRWCAGAAAAFADVAGLFPEG